MTTVRDSIVQHPVREADEEGTVNIADLAKDARNTDDKANGFAGFLRDLHVPLLSDLGGVVKPCLFHPHNDEQRYRERAFLGSFGYYDGECKTSKPNYAVGHRWSFSILVTPASFQTKASVLGSIQPLRTTINAIGGLPQIAKPMTVGRANLSNEAELTQVVSTATAFIGPVMDSITCFGSRWKPGYGPGDPQNTTYVDMVYVVSSRKFTDGEVIISFQDASTGPPYSTSWLLNQTTFAITGYYDARPRPFLFDLVRGESVTRLLQAVPPQDNFFTLIVDQDGYTHISMSRVFTSTFTNPPSRYACAASLRATATWSAVIDDAKATDETVVLILDQKLRLLVSSARRSAWSLETPAQSNETFSPILTAFVESTFKDINNVPESVTSQLQAKLDGKEDWIVLVSRIQVTSYSDDVIVLVSATPRKLIFERIDKARTRAMAIAIGLGISIVIVISSLFVLVTVPLRRLGTAMKMLTKMNFASLEDGSILKADSHITELRWIQQTFSTMVKAFAGGIKKNKEMVNRNVAAANSGSGKANNVAKTVSM
ncbi:hypothetical protein DFJ77DRAFT_440961 [Powellomyces hirtus]|nr:hypothetical protein DFJ77DRAFT_440961 [Powellomyces hirtus]